MTLPPAGLCLAAGASTRMGRPKALLPFGDQPAIERAVRTLLEGGCAPVVVILGAGADRVATGVPDHPEVRIVIHPGWAAGRTGSIREGLSAADAAATVLLPVDHPLVVPDDVRALIAAWQGGSAPVVRCVHGGRGGHPVLFTRAVAEKVRSLGPDDPLRDVLRAHRDREVRVEASSGVLLDMNTPDDYEAALRRWEASRPAAP